MAMGKRSSGEQLTFIEMLRQEAGTKHAIVETLLDSTWPYHEGAAAQLNQMWDLFSMYSDREYIREFCASPHARYWEMYLACAFADHPLLAPKPGPDLGIQGIWRTIWIEAVTPSAGAKGNANAVPYPIDGEASYVPTDLITLRFTSAFKEKHQKYSEYRDKHIVASHDPCIVAISSQDLPWHPDFMSFLSSLFPIGPLSVNVKLDAARRIVSTTPHYPYRPGLSKASGSWIDTMVFMNSDASQISGVIFCRPQFFRDISELRKSLFYVHNPFAVNPIRVGGLGVGCEVTVEEEGGHWQFYAHDELGRSPLRV
ncbi:MAG: hypothetical protein SFW09_23670 [Hyphomicrobiaceae bacterium]|nr:hypothetical protein [Hyphomicrobiaceae bacterium]